MTLLLTTLNATYAQTSLGLRYLMANIGDLDAEMMEFTIAQNYDEIVEVIVRKNPKILGISLYIWNYRQSLDVIKHLRKVSPQTVIIVGGPEVSYDWENVEPLVDYIICGEGERSFPDLCRQILIGEKPTSKVVPSEVIKLEEIKFPYHLYSDHDIASRRIMVESSRGCPFGCQFCLSSLDQRVRHFDLDLFLGEMSRLWNRGARNFKFIDRTFNLSDEHGVRVIDFFKEREGVNLHFEIVPDHLSDKILNALSNFPAGSVQFEIGVQSFNSDVSSRIGRKQDNQKVEENILKVVNMGNIHIHADLIVGLPGEDLQSFAEGFDRLRALGPHEIQVGILKKLKGAPIKMHSNLLFDSEPPYSIVKSDKMDYLTIRRMSRFARYWDIFANSGNFKRTIDEVGTFSKFLEFSDWLYERGVKTHSISLERQARLLLEYFPQMQEAITSDYMGVKGRTMPPFLREQRQKKEGAQKRQERHKS